MSEADNILYGMLGPLFMQPGSMVLILVSTW